MLLDSTGFDGWTAGAEPVPAMLTGDLAEQELDRHAWSGTTYAAMNPKLILGSVLWPDPLSLRRNCRGAGLQKSDTWFDPSPGSHSNPTI